MSALLRASCLVALVLTLTLTLGCGPLLTLPGGALSGEIRPTPSDWSFTDSVEHVQLETRPEDPYSVNIWGIGVGDVFYVFSAFGPDAEWAQNIAADPRVRLRVEDAIFELSAAATSDDGELDAFLAAAKTKYDFEPDPEETEEWVLFRLTPR